MSLTHINREERIALSPVSSRFHLAQIQNALVDVLDEVEADVSLRLVEGAIVNEENVEAIVARLNSAPLDWPLRYNGRKRRIAGREGK